MVLAFDVSAYYCDVATDLGTLTELVPFHVESLSVPMARRMVMGGSFEATADDSAVGIGKIPDTGFLDALPDCVYQSD